MQRGFLLGRSLLPNTIEMKHRMQAESLHGQHGSAFLFDFKAAFPSVVHGFLLDVLAYIGAPVDVLTFIRILYVDNKCNLIV